MGQRGNVYWELAQSGREQEAYIFKVEGSNPSLPTQFAVRNLQTVNWQLTQSGQSASLIRKKSHVQIMHCQQK